MNMLPQLQKIYIYFHSCTSFTVDFENETIKKNTTGFQQKNLKLTQSEKVSTKHFILHYLSYVIVDRVFYTQQHQIATHP